MGRSVVCRSNLRQISTCWSLWLSDHTNVFPNLYAPNLNGAGWTSDVGGFYWGTLLTAYSADARSLFRCPSSTRDADPWFLETGTYHWEQSDFATYGLNRMPLETRPAGARRLHGPPSGLDRAGPGRGRAGDGRQRLDDRQCRHPLRRPSAVNLTQWRSLLGAYPWALDGWWRHSSKSACNTVWMDGHVDAWRRTDGHDVDPRRYTGDW
jgi:prepilin-type processing-associated H-X9-DG protein